MTLGEKQSRFTELIARLILWAVEVGYKVKINEAYRPPETAALYARQGRGIKDSLHCIGLAVDLVLFKDGNYLTRTEDYEPLGKRWEQQDVLCRWGGRFGDGGHFSFEHEGRR